MSEDILTLKGVEQLYISEKDKLLGYLTKMSREVSIAEDILQEVFIKFLKHARDGGINAKTASHYLWRAAKNELVTYIRKHRELGLEVPDELQSQTNSAERVELAVLIRYTITEAIMAYPDEEEAQIIKMGILQEVPAKQIVEDTGKPSATIYRILEKGRNYLAEALKKAGINLSEMGGK